MLTTVGYSVASSGGIPQKMHGGGIELKKLFAGLLLLLLAAGAISGGCRPAEEGEVAPEPEQALIVAIGAEPENLDPLKMMSSPAATVSQHMVETLIYLDVDGALQPRLAESWEPSADGLAWDLKLREGVQFHDGTPFNAEAVKFNLDRFIGVDDPDQAAVFAFLLGEVREVEVVDDYLVRIHLNQQRQSPPTCRTLLSACSAPLPWKRWLPINLWKRRWAPVRLCLAPGTAGRILS